MENPQHAAMAKEISRAQGCCFGDKEAPCDMSQGPTSKLPGSTVFALLRVEKPVSAGMTAVIIDLPSPVNSPRNPTTKALTLGLDPPVPVYLLNVSLLC